jgi:Copper transport outer membrane protein, MctB
VFDFRYHALSLVAVFLALAIGILLGATIGDSLVSEAGKGLSSSLHSDVVNARNDARQAHAELNQRDKIISDAFPTVVQGVLTGQRIAVVATGSLPSSVESEIRQSVEVAGGAIDSVSTVDVPSQLDDLETAAQGRTPPVGTDPELVKQFGRRIGRSLVNAGDLTQQLHKGLPDAFRGDFQGAASVVYYRAPPPDNEDPKDKQLREAFEDGLAAGLVSVGAQVVGVEEQGTDPSQVGWYGDHKMSSVDSVDLPGGRLALVFVLNGEKGKYGIKGTADSALPKLPIGAGTAVGSLGG